MNLEALNRYVLLIIGLFALLFYLVTVVAGFLELASRMPKRKLTRQPKPGNRRLRNAKKSV
jgi:hypothetical protein